MLSRYYGHYVTLNELRDYLPPGRDGINAKQLCEVLIRIGLEYKIYKGSVETVSQIQLPVILYWNKQHFVILEKCKGESYYIVDPALGRTIYTKDEFKGSFTNYIISAKPKDTTPTRKKAKPIWLNYLSLMLKHKLLVLLIIILSFINYFLSLMFPLLIQKIIDDVNVFSTKLLVAAILVICAFCMSIFISSFTKVIFKTKLYQDLTKKVYEHLTKISYNFFELRSYGNLSFSLESIRIIKELYAEEMINVIVSFGAVIVLLIYIYIVNVSIFCIIALLLVFEIVMLQLLNKKILQLNQIEISSLTKLKEVQTEFIYSMLNIKIAGIEKEIYKYWEGNFDYSIKKTRKKDTYYSYYLSISSVMQIVFPFILLLICIILVKMDSMTLGMAISIYTVTNLLISNSVSTLKSLNSYKVASHYLDRINDIISQKIEEDGDIFINEINNISLQNVSFQYNAYSKKILNNVSMKFNKGETIAIVGESGSGKSTIAKLLLGLYQPSDGKVLYNGYDFNKLNKHNLKKLVGMVPQDNVLFNKTIQENIQINRQEINIDDIKKACHIAMIKDEIENMPMKYDTLISDRGMNLSGGQRQRIIIARAIVGNPQLLIFDEATSSLDTTNERKIMNNLNEVDSIKIIIAHRLSTIKDADMIYVMKNGEVVESGTHDELMRKGGSYSKLYRNQLKNT